MAVHVLAVLGYKEGDRVTSTFLADSVNTNPVIIRRLLLIRFAASEQFLALCSADHDTKPTDLLSNDSRRNGASTGA